MIDKTMEISKELYDLSMENGGRIPDDKEMEVFGASICCGYGLYGTKVKEKDGKYYCDYTTGSTCD